MHLGPLESYLPPHDLHQLSYALAQLDPKPEGGVFQSRAKETEGINTNKTSRSFRTIFALRVPLIKSILHFYWMDFLLN